MPPDSFELRDADDYEDDEFSELLEAHGGIEAVLAIACPIGEQGEAILAQVRHNAPYLIRAADALVEDTGMSLDEAWEIVKRQQRALREATDELLQDIDGETR